MTYAAPAPTEPYLVLTPAGVLRAYAQREPDATCLQLQSLMDGAVAPRRSAWLAAGEDRDALLAEAMAAGWVQEATRRLIAPDVQLDDYLPRRSPPTTASAWRAWAIPRPRPTPCA
jgi:hypothetical protein